jgi:hypothetical protein
MTSNESPRWVCSGDLVGTGHPTDRHEACDFTTDNESEAFSHFEATAHAVDPAQECNRTAPSTHAPAVEILAWAQAADLEALRGWLKRNDPNGDYDDATSEYGPLTREDALRNITEQVQD